MTTDGKPARISIAGFRISFDHRGANDDVKRAARIAMGAASRIARSVTLNEPDNEREEPELRHRRHRLPHGPHEVTDRDLSTFPSPRLAPIRPRTTPRRGSRDHLIAVCLLLFKGAAAAEGSLRRALEEDRRCLTEYKDEDHDDRCKGQERDPRDDVSPR